jgi:hypothetical protein
VIVSVNGEVGRIRRLYGDPFLSVQWKEFQARDVMRLKPTDVFLTVRAWDAAAKYLATSHPSERPLILQLADGHVNEVNCKKKHNRRNGSWLYAPLLCDVFICFNRALPLCLLDEEALRVRYARPAFPNWLPGAGRTQRGLWIVASGNDAFFGTEHREEVISAFSQILLEAQVRAKRIAPSLANRELAGALRGIGGAGERFGSIVQKSGAPEFLFTTPSTIALEALVLGIPVCVINCWDLDLNLPPEITWRPRTETFDQALSRIAATSNTSLAGNLFGAERLVDILSEIVAFRDQVKVDLRDSARRVKLTTLNALGSFLKLK